MRVFLLVAFILFIFAVIVASGTDFLTTWAVWLAGGLASFTLDALLGGWSVALPVYRQPPP